jgi:hypothetical protein
VKETGLVSFITHVAKEQISRAKRAVTALTEAVKEQATDVNNKTNENSPTSDRLPEELTPAVR